ncbi:MAG: GNAT family N-acetyltransferase [Litoreibacter sp.]|nr:GNAT family N-acetyltransferase [Litoreibacter sp.]
MDIRPTSKRDIAAVDELLARSYPALLKADYPPSVLVTALPLISRAQPRLVTCGTYFGVFDGEQLVGAGGWTYDSKRRGPVASIRHVVTDHERVRQGIGRALMDHILKTAQAGGVREMRCQATFTAVPYYRAMGFVGDQQIEVPLQPGIGFPAVLMRRDV